MNIASSILLKFRPFEVKESVAHVHDPKECAQFFRTYGIDPASTEREYAELIYGLVRAMKPAVCLELGTGMGLTALMIAAALKENGLGELTTVDTRYLAINLLAKQYNLPLKVVQSSSTDFLANQAEDHSPGVFTKYDFVFFDTVQEDKGGAAMYMLDREMFNDNALLVFHDTSLHRFQDETNPDAASHGYQVALCALSLSKQIEAFSFPFSRGLTIMRYNDATVPNS